MSPDFLKKHGATLAQKALAVNNNICIYEVNMETSAALVETAPEYSVLLLDKDRLSADELKLLFVADIENNQLANIRSPIEWACEKEPQLRGRIPWPIDDFLELQAWGVTNATNIEDTRVFIKHVRGLYDDTAMAWYFMLRYNLIHDFICHNMERLEKEGFLLFVRNGNSVVKRPLYEALCQLPYSRDTEINSSTRYTFDLTEVCVRTHELIEENNYPDWAELDQISNDEPKQKTLS